MSSLDEEVVTDVNDSYLKALAPSSGLAVKTTQEMLENLESQS